MWVTRVRTRREDRSSISSHSLADLGGEGDCLPHPLPPGVWAFPCFLPAARSSSRPARAEVGPGAGTARVAIALDCSLDPRLEPVAVPMLWPDLDQHDPGGLNEQTAQIAIAALRYAAEDRAVAGR